MALQNISNYTEIYMVHSTGKIVHYYTGIIIAKTLFFFFTLQVLVKTHGIMNETLYKGNYV